MWVPPHRRAAAEPNSTIPARSARAAGRNPARGGGEALSLFIGAATSVGGLHNSSEPQYKAVEQAQFSLTTAENACKFGPIHPKRDAYNWARCDAVFAAAAAANQSVRGHNLCWHTENPAWLTDGGFNSSEPRSILQVCTL